MFTGQSNKATARNGQWAKVVSDREAQPPCCDRVHVSPDKAANEVIQDKLRRCPRTHAEAFLAAGSNASLKEAYFVKTAVLFIWPQVTHASTQA